MYGAYLSLKCPTHIVYHDCVQKCKLLANFFVLDSCSYWRPSLGRGIQDKNVHFVLLNGIKASCFRDDFLVSHFKVTTQGINFFFLIAIAKLLELQVNKF